MIRSKIGRASLQHTVLLVFLISVPLRGWAAFEGISLNDAGVWGNNIFEQVGFRRTAPSISADGRFVLFSSLADNLVPGDTNNASDVFLRDRLLGTTKRVSVASDGSQADGPSFSDMNSMDRNGRFVVFGSGATNLLGSGVDTNGHWDVFLHDMQTGKTTLISRPMGFPAVQANGQSRYATISADGNWVAFVSMADNLIPSEPHHIGHIFLWDVKTGTLSRLSVSPKGEEGDGSSWQPSINADGTKVAFASNADNLVKDDKNGFYDVFVRDVTQGETYRVSVSDTGSELNEESLDPSISGDGCQVVFRSAATDIISGWTLFSRHIYLRDLCQGTTSWISQNFEGKESPFPIDGGHADASAPVISSNGRCVLFSAYGPNLSSVGHVDGSLENIYLRHLQKGTIQLISVADDGTATLGQSEQPAVNEDCNFVGFSSWATNLVPGSPSSAQIFVYTQSKLTASFTTELTSGSLSLKCDSSSSKAEGTTITTYAWDFGDGAVSTEPNPLHVYAKPGIYPVKLTIIDSAYHHASTQHDVTIASPNLISQGQLSGGGLDFGCSVRQGGGNLGSAWIVLLIFSSLIFIASRPLYHKAR